MNVIIVSDRGGGAAAQPASQYPGVLLWRLLTGCCDKPQHTSQHQKIQKTLTCWQSLSICRFLQQTTTMCMCTGPSCQMVIGLAVKEAVLSHGKQLFVLVVHARLLAKVLWTEIVACSASVAAAPTAKGIIGAHAHCSQRQLQQAGHATPLHVCRVIMFTAGWSSLHLCQVNASCVNNSTVLSARRK